MTRKRFHGLKKVKVRATWNKYNLYNLTRLRTPSTQFQTYYQQKWFAKSITRAYHGEHVREGYWERMFRPRMNAVVPMDFKYLAEYDGSEHAAGRGSGKDKPLNLDKIQFGKNQIPYMHMTYAPLERRLDMAVWRALFASSARQARQFCTHGLVRVNGQKMPYAGYLLNPGDMFQVEPDSVLFATGAKKELEQTQIGKGIRKERMKVWRRLGKKLKVRAPTMVQPRTVNPSKEPREESEVVQASKSPRTLEIIRAERKLSFDEMLLDAQKSMNLGKTFLGAKRKQHLRALMRDLKIARMNVNRMSEEELDERVKELVERSYSTRLMKRHEKEDEVAPKKPGENQTRRELLERYLKVRQDKMRGSENPFDPEKPYATPWRPRPYMSPFAFVPRYLEVNHRICSAVYLRHPVARPGMSEVPSPFGGETQQLAFNWYLRRR